MAAAREVFLFIRYDKFICSFYRSVKVNNLLSTLNGLFFKL
jgi:hypothetical protein